MDFRRKFEFGLAWRTIAPHRVRSCSSPRQSTTPGRARRPGRRRARRARRAGEPVELHPPHQFPRLALHRIASASRIIRSAFPTRAAAASTFSGETLDQALKTLQARHTQESAEARYLVGDRRRCAERAAHASIEDGRVEMLNKAARQLFARHAAAPSLEDLEALGPELRRGCGCRRARARSRGWSSTACRRRRSSPRRRSRASTSR